MSLTLSRVERLAGAERVLHPIDLTLESGSLTVLLGPVRAGKTSLMRLMAGLDPPTAGRIVDAGTDVTGQDVRRRSVSMVYQQFINYPNLTVRANIASPLKVAGVAASERQRRVRDMAERLDLVALLDRLPSELSGGQQQRCALARAMVKDSRLLLLDEPLVNLDYKLREGLRAEMKSLFSAGERMVVYATTEPQEALMLGGRTCVMHEGRIVQQGPALEVYRAPATLLAARLISDPPMNFLPGSIAAADSGRAIRLDGGVVVPLPRGFDELPAGRYTFGLHASHLSLSPAPGATELPATVELAEINGSETLLHGRFNDCPVLLQQEGVHHAAIGSAVTLRFDRRHLYAFDAAGALARAPRFQPVRPGEAQHGAHTAA